MHRIHRTWTIASSSVLLFASIAANAQPAASYISSPEDGSFSSSYAGGAGTDSLPAPQRRDQYIARPMAPFSHVAIAVTASSLGIGGQIAVPLAQKLNLRVGGNFFSYDSDTYTDDGISYNGTLKLRSAQATIDWFPFGGGFHLSPGVLMYNGLGGTAHLFVPANQGFQLNSVDYVSSTTNPVTGTGTISANKAGPMLLLGWGNIIPRSGRHFAVPFEFGAAYQGQPKITLALAGSACDDEGDNCQSVTTNAGLQANLAAQQKIVNDDASPYRFYPIISIGLSFKF
jgi:hypothetical protein